MIPALPVMLTFHAAMWIGTFSNITLEKTEFQHLIFLTPNWVYGLGLGANFDNYN